MSSQIINTKTREWQVLSHDHHLSPFTDYKQLNEKDTRVITRAEGVYIRGSEGNKIPDAMVGLWCVNVGYGREEPTQATTRQMRELSSYSLFFQTTHLPVVELAKAIADVASEGMSHVLFIGSGSEANDTVLRMVYHYWATRGQPQRKVVIGRWNGYHGSTATGISLGGMKALYEQGDFPIPGIVHIAQPYWYGEDGGMSPGEFGVQAAEQSGKKILEVGEEDVAAFIAEPTQGIGGAIVPPDTYRLKIREILTKHDILFIADEVICGFGRTDGWFDSQYYSNAPDLTPIVKDLTSDHTPMGGVVVRDKIIEMFSQGGEFYHGFTYSDHPMAAVVALENIRVLCEEEIIEKVKTEAAPHSQKCWQELTDHPLVDEAHGVGIAAALELIKDKKTRERFTDKGVGMLCREHCSRSGLIIRAVGDTMTTLPPLVIGPSQIDELITLARKCLDQIAAVILT